MSLTFNCSAENDSYCVLAKSGVSCPRYDSAAEAVERAAPGSAVLVLADGYPGEQTKLDPALFDRAGEKRLKLYIEYPDAIPGLEIGAPRRTEWERAVVSSDAFGDTLPRLSILAIHDCRFVPAAAKNPLLVVARVAGFDRAVFGLPEESCPILFEVPERNLLIATTKLSTFVTGRCAPYRSWKVVWQYILSRLDPASQIQLEWEPAVHPSFEKESRLPSDIEARAFKRAADWYHASRLLIHPSREAEIHEFLRSGAETVETPPPNAPVGDGSRGILEGYASAIRFDGSQVQRIPIRSDCNAEVAMALALDWAVNRSERSRKVAQNLLDYVFFTSGMHGGVRGDPTHPAFGLIAWGNIAPAWEVANYSDDDARVILSAMLTSACLGTDRWDASVLKALLANLRTTGTLGFRGDRIDIPQIEQRGWESYHDSPTINYSPHHESYLWACNLWAYHQTRYKPFIERTKTAIRMTMEAYPSGWRWKDSIERARMLLCLAWLVRLEDTEEHRRWLYAIADDLIALQDDCGAIREHFVGGPGGFRQPRSNEEYGTTEIPLVQEDGDPASDQLYTTGFALGGFHEAYFATRDPKLKQAEDRLAEYMCRIQVRAKKHPYLDGTWFRAFDYRNWEYWASSGDVGWGAWSVESGWGPAWITAVLGLRLKGVSIWDLTSDSRIIEKFGEVWEGFRSTDGERING